MVGISIRVSVGPPSGTRARRKTVAGRSMCTTLAETTFTMVGMAEEAARDAFARLVKLPDSEMDLAEGALWIAAEEYPDMRVGFYLDQIERLARELPRRGRAGCEALLGETYQGQVTMRPAFLKPVLKRQILARILNNLKTTFMAQGDLARALAASDRIVLADPHLTAEWRDRGMIEHQLRRDRD